MHTPHNASMANNSSSPSSPQSSYNSSYGSNSGQKLINNSNSSSIAALVPGGVVTTQNISTVIKPKGNNNSLQFVKIQTPELSKTAVEQIRIAEETKISKDKVKEVEEEWQNNLLSWKSKRRQQITQTLEQAPIDPFDTSDNASGRKIKTFAEMIEQRAKSGNRLGFHMQRYLGDEEEDCEEEEDAAVNQLSSTNEAKDFHNNNVEPDPSKNRADSDYEAQSSTSSGYNQLDSKSSSSSSETPLDNLHKTLEVPLYPENNLLPTCDIDSRNSSTPDQDQDQLCHSISLVDNPNTNQLNSTLKQGIRPPQANSTVCVEPPPIDAKKVEILGRSEDEIDHSGSEEEDDDEGQEEEEEEQKHLQRIAFEAKLRAFEKMTKPSLSKPELTPPKRIIRPAAFSQQNNLKKFNSVDEEHQRIPPKVTEPIRSDKVADKPIVKEEREVHLSPRPQGRIAHESFSTANSNNNDCMVKSSTPKVQSGINEDKIGRDPSTEAPINTQHSFIVQGPPPNYKNPDCMVQEPVPRVQSNASLDSMTQAQIPRLQSGVNLDNVTQDTIPNVPCGTKHSHFVQESIPIVQKGPNHSHVTQNPIPRVQSGFNREYLAPEPKIQSSIKSSGPTHEPLPKAATGANQICATQKHQRSLPTQPLPPEIPNNVSNQRKPARDDKDRTVLSVSGKKRCSSCKEELGRGAAAFVVESLSLVYHTNCFRCSVCHVNLSNGFRGVDVRVHAGALHCQNCYSKDGLNYSRV